MNLSELSEQLAALEKQAGHEEAAACELELTGSELLVSGNEAALLSIASRCVKLVASGRAGSHFTIDRADIAPDASASLTIARA